MSEYKKAILGWVAAPVLVPVVIVGGLTLLLTLAIYQFGLMCWWYIELIPQVERHIRR